jgi:hypothetical protein
MENAVILAGSLVTLVTLFVFYDWLVRRRDRRARQHYHAPR